MFVGQKAAIIPMGRPGLLTLAWWWRYEIMLVVGLPVVTLWAAARFGWPRVIAVMLALALLVISVPVARREVWGWIRCVYVAHRIRSGCVEALVVNRRGRIPSVLWTAATPYGERVWLWCRAGTTATELERAGEILAVCCLAPAVEVSAHPRHPALVLVDVIRYGRDPTGDGAGAGSGEGYYRRSS
ncbi:hypothetical protein Psi01_06270 [Planobispora siamensis]|uniref:Uncharacterized protein n=2 Tax=Planobispora siamensis TaxID=936338 RepID=A0A8J3SC01_9ACTN|nr:hypothetical protein Psi01_06270 [Planobispora siamensis]